MSMKQVARRITCFMLSATHFMLVSCLGYSSALKEAAHFLRNAD
jgi:hypothetical protein